MNIATRSQGEELDEAARKLHFRRGVMTLMGGVSI
jgi:hypothetical protein